MTWPIILAAWLAPILVVICVVSFFVAFFSLARLIFRSAILPRLTRIATSVGASSGLGKMRERVGYLQHRSCADPKGAGLVRDNVCHLLPDALLHVARLRNTVVTALRNRVTKEITNDGRREVALGSTGGSHHRAKARA